jgi:large subunit ribosomal protein L54
MICRRCALRLSLISSVTTSSRRAISTTPSNAAEAISTKTIEQAKPRQNGNHPLAISSAAQPFTAPLSVSSISHGEKSSKKKASDIPTVLSSCTAGTPLRGLNFIKGKTDPVAMEDHEYPEWLWDVLKPKNKEGNDAVDGDLYSKSKKTRAKAKKALKAKGTQEEVFEKVPLYEQTIDLPSGNGTEEGALEAAGARQELTKAMRNKRRATIKEANFLRTMR